MPVRIKNRFGTLTGWNQTTVNLLGRDLEGITEFEYSDETDIKPAYGAGDTPIGHEDGKYEAKASITLLLEELVPLQKSLPPGARLSDIPAFDVIVEFEIGNQIITDRIEGCRFKNNGRAVKQGDGKIAQKIDLVPIEIKYGS